MISYTKEEIQSSTSVSRNFGNILDCLKNRELEKVAVMRNNKMEAVLISVEEYELLKAKYEIEEHEEIYRIVKSRESEPLEKANTFEDVLKEYGIGLNEL